MEIANSLTQFDIEDDGFKPQIRVPAEDELARIAAAVPPMTGAEYLTEEVLAQMWGGIDRAFDAELAESGLPVQEFLKSRHPAWNLVGRVHFNLAENRFSGSVLKRIASGIVTLRGFFGGFRLGYTGKRPTKKAKGEIVGHRIVDDWSKEKAPERPSAATMSRFGVVGELRRMKMGTTGSPWHYDAVRLATVTGRCYVPREGELR